MLTMVYINGKSLAEILMCYHKVMCKVVGSLGPVTNEVDLHFSYLNEKHVQPLQQTDITN